MRLAKPNLDAVAMEGDENDAALGKGEVRCGARSAGLGKAAACTSHTGVQGVNIHFNLSSYEVDRQEKSNGTRRYRESGGRKLVERRMHFIMSRNWELENIGGAEGKCREVRTS